MTYPGSSWTDERVERLRVLCAEGLSAGQMAEELGGITRNAVISKINRSGMAFGVKMKPGRKPRLRTYPFVERKHKPPDFKAEVATELPPEPVANPVTLMQLTDDTCRWPVDMPSGPIMYCGAKQLAGCPYCCRHSDLAFQQGRRTTEAERHLMILRARRLNGLAKTFDKPLQSTSE